MSLKEKILDKNAYYAFKNKLLCFNKQYEERLQGTAIDETYFEPIAKAWESIAAEYPNDVKLEDIKEEHFEMLRKASKEVYDRLKSLAEEKTLGGFYDKDDEEDCAEYTYVAGEILDLGMLALHTYTKIFEKCEQTENRNLGFDKSKSLADAFYDESKLEVVETTENVKEIYTVPYLGAKKYIGEHNEKNYLKRLTIENRIPYIEYKMLRDNNRLEAFPETNSKVVIDLGGEEEIVDEEAIPEVNEENKEQGEAEPEANEQNKDKEEVAPVKEEPAVDLQPEAKKELLKAVPLEAYNEIKKAIHVAENNSYDASDLNHAFYKNFNQFANDMGLRRISAQALISATMMAHVKTLKSDNEEFREKMLPVYRHFRREVFESYVHKCVSKNEKIDLNYASKEIDRIMGAVYYTVDPIGLKENDPKAIDRAKMLMTGELSRDEHEIGIEDRDLVLEHQKAAYRRTATSRFNADVDARFNSYTAESKSSGSIVRNASKLLKQYEKSKKSTKTQAAADRFTQAELKKLVMDEACALERRIETRYASGAAKFFRFISYARQLSQLNSMKAAVGISSKEKMADRYLDIRLNDRFVDDSDRIQYDRASREVDEKTLTEKIVSDFDVRAELPKVTKDDMQQTYYDFVDFVSSSSSSNDTFYNISDAFDMNEMLPPRVERTVPLVPEDGTKKEIDDSWLFEDDEAKASEVKEENEAEVKEEKEEEQKEEQNDNSKEEPKEEPKEETEPEKYILNGIEYEDIDVYERALRLFEEEEAQKALEQEKCDIRKILFDKKLKTMEQDLIISKRLLTTEREVRESNLRQTKHNLEQKENKLKRLIDERKNAEKDLELMTEQYKGYADTLNSYTTALYETDNGKIESASTHEEANDAIKKYVDEDAYIKSIKDIIHKTSLDMEIKNKQLKHYNSEIKKKNEEIAYDKTQVGNLQRPYKREAELENEVRGLERDIAHWKDNEERIVKEGLHISDYEINEYKRLKEQLGEQNIAPNLPEDYEAPISTEELTEKREPVKINLNNDQNVPVVSKVEDKKKSVKILEK